MTSKSKLENIASMPHGLRLGAEIARYGDALFDFLHGEGYHDVDNDVDDRRRRERLEHLEGEFLHRASARGQLHQADGERDRAVLDGVEELRGERRQGDTKRHRYQ